jgi:putative ABC transport system permease protein
VTVVGIAVRSLRVRALSTALTAAGVALAVGLVLMVFSLLGSAKGAFKDAAVGYDVVLGGTHTSALTTVLSTVFLADQPKDVIPIEGYEAVRKDGRVRFAVPFAVGDTYRGWRVVGTTPAFFDAIEDADRRPLRSRVRPRVFGEGAEFEAVVGGIAAARTGLVVGSRFRVTHGVEEHGDEHEEEWTVVGILEPTGTPVDRGVFIPLESFFHVKGHERHDGPGGEEGHGEKAPWAVSAIVVRLVSPALRAQFAADMNRRSDLQAAIPVFEIQKMFDRLMKDEYWVFQAVAWVVLAVSALTILVGLYDSVVGRRREIALLRALGARRAHVFGVVVLEAVLLCLLGGIAGLALGHGAVAAVAPRLLDAYGIRVASSPDLSDLAILAGLVWMGVVAGLLPAWRAFSVPVAANLHPVD